MNDVLEAARRIVAWDDSGKLADDEWLVEKNETAIIAICRALLGMREALEKTTSELRDLRAMVHGECPSLLEDHFSAPNIDAAIEAGEAAIEKATKP